MAKRSPSALILTAPEVYTPPVPAGFSGPSVGGYAGGTPNYERDALGGITTRTPLVPDPPAQDLPLSSGLASRRRCSGY